MESIESAVKGSEHVSANIFVEMLKKRCYHICKKSKRSEKTQRKSETGNGSHSYQQKPQVEAFECTEQFEKKVPTDKPGSVIDISKRCPQSSSQSKTGYRQYAI